MKPDRDEPDATRAFLGHDVSWWLDIESVLLEHCIADGEELSNLLSSTKPRAPNDWSGY